MKVICFQGMQECTFASGQIFLPIGLMILLYFLKGILCYAAYGSFKSLPFLFDSDAAIVMLSGQVADGFTTIFAGELVLSKLQSSQLHA